MLKKVWSWNPTKCKKISLKKASEQYLEYMFHHFDQRYYGGSERCQLLVEGKYKELGIKDFKTWLSTEI